MTKDENKDITLIKYNHLNLPTEIQFTNNRTINYMYDATGVKKQKQVFDGTYTTITDYIDGYQYENKHINIGGRGYTHLLFFPHAEGYVKPVYSENKTLTTRLFSYVYNHTDHLGNIRVSYAKVDGVIEVLEENHYYAFGLKHQNYNDNTKKLSLKVSNNQKQITSTVENPFKYKFNARELQNEFDLNWYDYGARNYQADLGRWFNIDLKAEKYLNFSPYIYAANSPISVKDANGKELILGDNRRQNRKAFRELKKLSNDRLKLNGKTGKVTIAKKGVRNKSKKLNNGTKLISNVVGSKNKVTIISRGKFNKDYNQKGSGNVAFNPNSLMFEDSDSTNGVGVTDATVVFDSTDKGENIKNEDGTTGRSTEIGLAHELIHGSRLIFGKVITNDNEDFLNYTDPDNAEFGFGGGLGTNYSTEEIEVRFIENDIRSEQKVKLRATPKYKSPYED